MGKNYDLLFIYLMTFLGFQLELTISYGFYFQLIPVVAREILGEPSAGRKF